MPSKIIRIRPKDEIIEAFKNELRSREKFELVKSRFNDINLLLCYGIISNFNQKVYYKIRAYFNNQQNYCDKLDENNLFNNSNNEKFKNELRKYNDFYLIESFYSLTINEYANYIYDCYYDLIGYTNSKIYFENESRFIDKMIFTKEEFAIEIKPAEIFNFNRYVTPQNFGEMYECLVDSSHVNLNEIFYERLKHD